MLFSTLFAITVALSIPAYAPAQEGCASFSVSAYVPWCPGCSGITADGTNAHAAIGSVVAVDPRVIPLQSTVEIEGYGTFRAADTGGGIRGYMLDMLVGDYSWAINFGRRLLNACFW